MASILFPSWVRVLAALVLVIALASCAQTRGRRGAPEQSGFLGDYSQLERRDDFQYAEIYLNPNADWPKYDSVHLDSVTIWVHDDKGTFTDEEKQMLTDVMYKALYDELSGQFKMVETAGPRVLRIRAAITQAKGAKVVLRTLTTWYPQARTGTALASRATNTAALVGTAAMESEVLDSVTVERLAAVVDRRSGNEAMFTKRTFKTWGDVQAACEFWGRRAAFNLVKLGVRRKPNPEELDKEPREF